MCKLQSHRAPRGNGVVLTTRIIGVLTLLAAAGFIGVYGTRFERWSDVLAIVSGLMCAAICARLVAGILRSGDPRAQHVRRGRGDKQGAPASAIASGSGAGARAHDRVAAADGARALACAVVERYSGRRFPHAAALDTPIGPSRTATNSSANACAKWRGGLTSSGRRR